MARSLFIVSRTKPGTYAYLKLVSDSEEIEVLLDRRELERRQNAQRVTAERRNGERRRRNVMSDLVTSGWVLVRR